MGMAMRIKTRNPSTTPHHGSRSPFSHLRLARGTPCLRASGLRVWFGRRRSLCSSMGTGDSKVGDMKGMGENLRYITPEQAKTVLGEYVIPIHGTSFIFWDEGGVGMDYYTWWAHLILGSMRVYASLSLIKGQKTPLDEPARFMVPHSPSPSPSQAHISLMRSTFPSSPIEGKEAWTAYKDTGSAYVWERLVLVSPPRNLSAPATSHTLTLTTPPPLPFWSPSNIAPLSTCSDTCPFSPPTAGSSSRPSLEK
ncbi:hypothetical protein BJ165DRAFT_297108 [Panaeolus papilionaceus]|nr:hypothetical protein BJ165DRAFT_297108 [Panaeolus papilionaceus]